MRLSLIAAVGKNNELGYNNNLIFDLPSDLKFFRDTTIGKTVVMGKNTYKSIGHPLPKRKNIVLSNSLEDEKVTIFHNKDEFVKAYENIDEEIFIIGGARVYGDFINEADNIYLTEVNKEALADTYFPKFNKEEYDEEILESGIENDLEYKRVLYRRKK